VAGRRKHIARDGNLNSPPMPTARSRRFSGLSGFSDAMVRSFWVSLVVVLIGVSFLSFFPQG
jgi:hypothetical protein